MESANFRGKQPGKTRRPETWLSSPVECTVRVTMNNVDPDPKVFVSVQCNSATGEKKQVDRLVASPIA